MSTLSRRIELAANIAILIVVTLILGSVIANYSSSKRGKQLSTISIGSKITLPGESWDPNRRTLVLALSTTCHFCSDSLPFYRRVIKERDTNRVKIIAVVPQSTEEGKRYLIEHGINVDEVRQLPLKTIQVRGTPTLILIDEKGSVNNAWFGKLRADKEDEVLQRIHL